MTMTREEYLKFVLSEHKKVLNKEQKDAAPGTVVVFHGFYGRAEYIRTDSGDWDITIR